MTSGLRRTIVIAAVAVAAAGAGLYALMRPAPRHGTPLMLDSDGIEREPIVHDQKGRAIISHFRTVEPRVLYRGSGFPTSFPTADGGSEYADRTAFDFLRSLNVRHVLALVDSPEAYYAEDGYLRYWSGQTGFEIGTTWVQIDPAGAFGRDDRSGLRAGGILIALMRENAARGGAVYVHDPDGVSHAGVAAAAYELWRNRGWDDFETTWTLVERRFRPGRPESLRSIRDELRFLIEL
jgi:catechol 2,3-dioxygenase-like lactoylglutathione lyase family enzyme